MQTRDTSKFWEQNRIPFVIFLGWKRACWCWQITNEIPSQSDKECKSGPVRYRYSDCNTAVGVRCSDQKATCFTASLIMLLCWSIKHLSMQQQITEPRGHDCIICLRFVLPWALKRVSYLNTVFTTSRQRRGSFSLSLVLSAALSLTCAADGVFNLFFKMLIRNHLIGTLYL